MADTAPPVPSCVGFETSSCCLPVASLRSAATRSLSEPEARGVSAFGCGVSGLLRLDMTLGIISGPCCSTCVGRFGRSPPPEPRSLPGLARDERQRPNMGQPNRPIGVVARAL
eukprot:1489627-Prymnesium_polylepis.1